MCERGERISSPWRSDGKKLIMPESKQPKRLDFRFKDYTDTAEAVGDTCIQQNISIHVNTP